MMYDKNGIIYEDSDPWILRHGYQIMVAVISIAMPVMVMLPFFID